LIDGELRTKAADILMTIQEKPMPEHPWGKPFVGRLINTPVWVG
jgi:hypothetical protein